MESWQGKKQGTAELVRIPSHPPYDARVRRRCLKLSGSRVLNYVSLACEAITCLDFFLHSMHCNISISGTLFIRQIPRYFTPRN